MIFGAILAGGVGSRMNISDMPKQFLSLGNKPIIIHTLEKFLLCEKIDEIYIGVHANWLVHMEDLIDKYIKMKKDRIHVVAGGSDRNSTIMNIVAAIEKDHGESDEHYIVTHDSVRPFVTARILNDNVESVLKYKATDTVTEAVDTIVVSEEGKVITDIPDRRKMYQGQTPQTFRRKTYLRIYETLDESYLAKVTDAARILTEHDCTVGLVMGEEFNIKITTEYDLSIATFLLTGQHHD